MLSRKDNWLKRFGYFSLTILVVMIVTLAVWKFYPYKTIEYTDGHNSKAKILTPQIRAGEEVAYEFSYCKYTDKPAMIKKKIKNHGTIGINAYLSNGVKVGCVDNVQASVITLGYMTPGFYRVEVDMIYQVSPLQEITKTLVTEDFEIIE